MIVTLLTSNAFAQTGLNVNLGWEPSPDSAVTAYKLYYGVASQTYTNFVVVGNVTNTTFTGLLPGMTYFFSIIAVNALGDESPFSNEVSYSVPLLDNPSSSNSAPFISAIADQVIEVNGSTPPLVFTVGDQESAASDLKVYATSSNPVLVPNENISLAGAGSNWTVVVTPALAQTGTVTIALTVCDISLCTTTNFQATINPSPVIALTEPQSGGIYTAPAAINLASRITANGHVIRKVQFFNGAALVGEAVAAPYTLSWSGVGPGQYSLAAALVYDGTNTIVSTPIGINVIPASALVPPWQTIDIGSVRLTGSASISNGLYTVRGAGNISSSSDNFCFLYQGLSGDGEIRVQMGSLENTGANALGGVMIRETLTSGSRYAFMGISPNGSIRWQRRCNTGAGTSSTKGGSGVLPNIWVRVVRKGNTLYGYKSTNGSSWTQVNSSIINMATNIYVGLTVASGATTTTSSVACTNPTVVP